MSKAAKGLFAIVAVAMLVVTLGAGRSADEQDANVAVEKAVRTAGVDVAIGYFTCRGTVTGEVTAGIQWQGTTGVSASGGLNISVTTLVAPAEADASCLTITDGAVALAEAETCTVSSVRLVGVTRDAVMVCSGITDDTNDSVAQLSRYIAANVRAE